MRAFVKEVLLDDPQDGGSATIRGCSSLSVEAGEGYAHEKYEEPCDEMRVRFVVEGRARVAVRA